MFKTALALMRAYGYRPATTLQHKTTVEFCEAVLDSSWKASLGFFDDMWQKRNRLTYDGDVMIGRPEAEAAIMEAIEHDNPTLKGVLPKDYARPTLDK